MSPAYATPRLWLLPSRRRYRHAAHPGLSRPPRHKEHRDLHRDQSTPAVRRSCALTGSITFASWHRQPWLWLCQLYSPCWRPISIDLSAASWPAPTSAIRRLPIVPPKLVEAGDAGSDDVGHLGQEHVFIDGIFRSRKSIKEADSPIQFNYLALRSQKIGPNSSGSLSKQAAISL